MGLIKEFRNKTVFLDTAPIIYYIEENKQFIKKLDKIFTANNNGLFIFKTSVITLIEVLIMPLRQDNYELALQYKSILSNSKTLEIVDINIEIALQTAIFRAKYGLKTPDAIQIAAAIQTSSSYFLTNDIHLKKVKEIKVITLDELD